MQAIMTPSGAPSPSQQTAASAAAKASPNGEAGGFRSLVDGSQKNTATEMRTGGTEDEAHSESTSNPDGEDVTADDDAGSRLTDQESTSQIDTHKSEKSETALRWPMGLGALQDGAKSQKNRELVTNEDLSGDQNAAPGDEIEGDRPIRVTTGRGDGGQASVGSGKQDIAALQKAMVGLPIPDEASDAAAASHPGLSHATSKAAGLSVPGVVGVLAEGDGNAAASHSSPTALSAVMSLLSRAKPTGKDMQTKSGRAEGHSAGLSPGAKVELGETGGADGEEKGLSIERMAEPRTRDSHLSRSFATSKEAYASREPIDTGAAKPAVASPGMVEGGGARTLQAMSHTTQSLIDVVQENTGWTRHLSAPSVRATETARGEGSVLQSLKIQLSPVELGSVELRLKMVQGQMQVDIRVQNEQAYQVLSQDQEALAGVMRGLGYRIDAVSISSPGADVANGQAFSNSDSQHASGESSQRKQTGESKGDGNGQASNTDSRDDGERRLAAGDYI